MIFTTGFMYKILDGLIGRIMVLLQEVKDMLII